jgi:hypothetical protein
MNRVVYTIAVGRYVWKPVIVLVVRDTTLYQSSVWGTGKRDIQEIFMTKSRLDWTGCTIQCRYSDFHTSPVWRN